MPGRCGEPLVQPCRVAVAVRRLGPVSDRVIDSEAVEEPPVEGGELSADVRPVPDARGGGELDSWRGEVKESMAYTTSRTRYRTSP